MNPLDALPRQTAGRVASPAWALLGLFVAFKTLLLAVALLSPGPGYDTSTNLLMAAPDTSSNLLAAPDTSTNLLAALAHRLTRWDAIYFTAVARRGAYVFENEWAFGWGMTTAIRLGAQGRSSRPTCTG
jgi:phosphatidylinositol glycan class V